MREPTEHTPSSSSTGSPAGRRGRRTGAPPHRIRRRAPSRLANQEEIGSAIRSLLVQLAALAETEGIPVAYFLESTILVGLRHRNTFIRKRLEAADDDLARQIGLEVRTMAKRRYRQDLGVGSRSRDRKAEG